MQGVLDGAVGLGGIYGGPVGAGIAVGWELGKHYGPSKWYGSDDTKWFK